MYSLFIHLSLGIYPSLIRRGEGEDDFEKQVGLELSSDDIIDLQDFTFLEGKYLEFAFVVESSNLNGDGLADTQDCTIWEVNCLNFVFEARP